MAIKRLTCVWSCLLLLAGIAALPDRVLAQSADDMRWSSWFTVDPNGVDGQLFVAVEIDFGFHIYGTKKSGSAIPTKISLKKGFSAATLLGSFEADADPVPTPELDGGTSLHHEGFVTWAAPIKLATDVDSNKLSIPVRVDGQICVNQGSCNMFGVETEAALRRVSASTELLRPEHGHAAFRGTLTPKTVRAGQTATLRIEFEPESGWTISEPIGIQAGTKTDGGRKPTLFFLTKTNDWMASDAILDAQGDPSKPAWVISLKVPRQAESKTYSLGGLVGFQALQGDSAESNPAAFGFTVELPVGSEVVEGSTPLTLNAEPTYQQVSDQWGVRWRAQLARAGAFANYSLPAVMGLALLAGFILNFMPCVLPVIGLKIMSFVHQAGQDSRRIFLFNLAFAAGVMAVFMLLAFVASQPYGGGWGGLFQSDTFQIVMIGVVFAFALSFLSVWEIPIPGMSGAGVGKLAAKEGLFGAFLKGIITTLLATPCSGPLLVPTVIWALAQPPLITYVTFGAMGLGMALPYLAIGLFPRLIGLLPRPGNWMVTFKHAMGYAMLGAGIFLFGSLKEKFAIPTLSMALAIAIACSIVGHTSIGAELGQKLKAWAYGAIVLALGCWIAFYVLIPAHELDWQMFSKVALKEELEKGNIVFVDFTADW